MFGFKITRLEIVGVLAMLIAVVALPWAMLASADAARAKAEVKTLRGRIEAPATGYIARLTTCQANTTALDGKLAVQNEAVKAWQAEADRLRRQGAAALARAEAETRAAQRRVTDILRATVRPGEDQCAAASRLIEETAR